VEAGLFGFMVFVVGLGFAYSIEDKGRSASNRINWPLASNVQPLYITVDPERDTPDVLRAFLREQYPRFIGVTGSREQIDNAKRAFRVFAQRRDEGASDYVIPHTAITYVLDPAGRFIDHWPDSLGEDTLVMRLGTLLNG
jgi:cytochrome oxidase Cu insertion factor (SCO1/SenC/PrrC family)